MKALVGGHPSHKHLPSRIMTKFASGLRMARISLMKIDYSGHEILPKN